ncbi:OsmC family protein [Cellulomonas composti]|uniref:OsmC family protein n=1 Tax=Cellulomonas composti TaxID=266130 RepID=UPI0011BE0183|nr:OsmC family protein [Cellulomonas composti]
MSSETSPTTTPDAATTAESTPANAGGTRLWVERIGPRRYVGHSSRGARVEIGDISYQQAFTPGELLKIALAGCSGLSADVALARRLGDDVEVSIDVAGLADDEEDRYPTISERLVVDLSGLEPDARARLLTVMQRAIDQHCTVGRTLKAGAAVDLTVDGER